LTDSRRLVAAESASRGLRANPHPDGTFRASVTVMARVLVADDDLAMLCAVADVLERLGCDVSCAEDGADLVDRLASGGLFDLIVSDVSMPWMDGLKTLRSMWTAGLATPVIVMTALKDERIQDQVRALGPNAVLLRKPFELDELEAAVAKLIPAPPIAERPS
jgi:CheY-like chemotaxis protein